MKKIIAFDCDGTLVNDDGFITPKTKDIIEKMSKITTLVFSSGRSPEGVKKVKEQLNINDDIFRYDICFNGALTVDSLTGKVLNQSLLKLKDVEKVYKKAKKENVGFYAVGKDKIYLEKPITNSKIEVTRNNQEYVFTNFDKLNKNLEITKLVISNNENPEITQKFVKKIKNEVETKYSITIPDKASANFEIANIEANKGSALSKLCDYLNVDIKDALCFGDAGNDIPMFKTKNDGIAMKNATQELKDVATLITDSNNNDGIALFLEPLYNKYLNEIN